MDNITDHQMDQQANDMDQSSNRMDHMTEAPNVLDFNVEQVIDEIKSNGSFDKFRKECLNDKTSQVKHCL